MLAAKSKSKMAPKTRMMYIHCLIALVIGLVLGKLCESNLRRALIVSKGSWATFFTSPISLFFILLSLFMLFFPYIKKKLAARRAAA